MSIQPYSDLPSTEFDANAHFDVPQGYLIDGFERASTPEAPLMAGAPRGVTVGIIFDNDDGTESTHLMTYDYTIGFGFNTAEETKKFQESPDVSFPMMQEYDERLATLIKDHNGFVETEVFKNDLEEINKRFLEDMNEQYDFDIQNVFSEVYEGYDNIEPDIDPTQPTASVPTSAVPSLG